MLSGFSGMEIFELTTLLRKESLLLSIFLCIMWRSVRKFLAIEIKQNPRATVGNYGPADFRVFLYNTGASYDYNNNKRPAWHRQR
jgi:hypothetical protein